MLCEGESTMHWDGRIHSNDSELPNTFVLYRCLGFLDNGIAIIRGNSTSDPQFLGFLVNGADISRGNSTLDPHRESTPVRFAN